MSAASSTRTYRDIIGDCVHCGFCLPACPTYVSWGDEMDSPRGRIDLMKGVHDGVIALDATVVAHFDACLGCMACVTACPSGVRYDLLIESTRATVESEASRAPLDRAFRALMFALMPYPARLRWFAVPLIAYAKSGLQGLVRRSGVLRLLPRRLAQLDALLPPLAFADLRRDVPAFTGAKDDRTRARVGLVAGCVQRAFFPNVNEATVRVLSAEGCDVTVPTGQGCCGALSLHSGRLEEAKRFARGLIERFEFAPIDAVVVNAAGCGSALKEYGELLGGEPAYAERARAFSAKVRDVNEFLVTLEPQAPRGRIEQRVAYHDACHLAHAQRIREAPRALLASIPGLELLEIPQGDQCCGSAGTYNLFEPASAREIGERKADNVASVAPDLLASANPGCTLQIQSIMRERGATLTAAHPIELLDLAIRAAGAGSTKPRSRST
ncbi:MAG TPA: heterodisulfide reductase-related iron-sulfur binding cluster [Candidatus Lustribacter sp.]|nr:heterodisulfide reductase-related iron-sulfur binding cluster [Candidatus Lustribacter sp.]